MDCQLFGAILKIARMVRGRAFCFTYESGSKIARTMRGKKSDLYGKMTA
jgi:hypothetical protein